MRLKHHWIKRWLSFLIHTSSPGDDVFEQLLGHYGGSLSFGGVGRNSGGTKSIMALAVESLL